MSGHSRQAQESGGWGRHLENKMARPTKHRLDRLVHKRVRKGLSAEARDAAKQEQLYGYRHWHSDGSG